MNTSKFQFKKEFPNTGETFSGTRAAEKWLRERGYAIGTVEGQEPRAIQKGAIYLPKWKHYNWQEREALDGIAMCENNRDGTVTVYLLSDPGKSGI